MKESIISLKNPNKPVRVIAKTLALANYVAHSLKEKNALVNLGIPKDPEEHGKQLWWVTEKFLPW